MARDRSSRKLNVMGRSVAATVARDLDSDSLLPNEANSREIEMPFK